MKQEVFDYLISTHGFSTISDTKISKMIKLPGREIIINDRPIKEPPQDATIIIEYLGEGSFFNVGEEEQPLYGFKMMRDDVWIENMDDFKYWFELFFSKLIEMQKNFC